MIRLVVAGPQTKILSTLCAACPYSPAGCCVAPPRLDLSDVGRVVMLGGRDWLLEELAAGRLTAGERWLSVKRTKKRRAAPGAPRIAACVYLGDAGCTIDHGQRSATCNYYVCESALTEAEEASREDAASARAVHDDLVKQFVAWDAELARRAAVERPEGVTFDAAFLDWLGVTFAKLSRI